MKKNKLSVIYAIGAIFNGMPFVPFRDIHFIPNFSNRSFLALQIGQSSGGSSRAHKYPHTVHL